MANLRADPNIERPTSWLLRPLPWWWCVVGWSAATALFVQLAHVMGGLDQIDFAESSFSTWAVAHGQFSCAFPSKTLPYEPLIAPFYVIYSGIVAAVTQIGHTVPFPTTAALGPHCSQAVATIQRWSVRTNAVAPTERIAYSSWLFLMAGLIMWIRSVGRGRTLWEPVALLIAAALSPVTACVQSFFHPQDLVAMGFALAALACAVWDRWTAAGILMALAVLTQQYALLVAIPLVVLAPPQRRPRLVASAVGAAAILVLPLALLSSGNVLRAITVGSGNGPWFNMTVLGLFVHSGLPVILLSRAVPLVLAVAIAVVFVRRVGPSRACEPTTLMAVVGVSLALRLVFEENIFSYYFMALAVALLAFDVARGRIRGSWLAWVTCVTLVYWPFWGRPVTVSYTSIPFSSDPLQALVVVAAVGTIVVRYLRRVVTLWDAVLALLVVACALVNSPDPNAPLHHQFPFWFWQVALVLPGLALAAGPLRAEWRRTPAPSKVTGAWWSPPHARVDARATSRRTLPRAAPSPVPDG